jgi:hypothetical protein
LALLAETAKKTYKNPQNNQKNYKTFKSLSKKPSGTLDSSNQEVNKQR